MSSVYLFCLSLGFVFTVAGAILGQLLGGGDHGNDAGGHDAGGHDLAAGHDAGGHDAGHGAWAHGALDLNAGPDAPEFSHSYDAGGDSAGLGEGDVSDGAHGDSGGGHLPLLSPTVISFFLFMFGGTGLLYHRVFGISSPWIHTPLAVASASAAGVGLAWVLYKVTSTLESNRLARLSDALAAPAEVTISVPAQGMGEVAYTSAGTRQTLSARSADGREYKQGSAVRVLKVTDGVAWVGEAPLRPAAIGEVAPGEPARGEPVRQKQRH